MGGVIKHAATTKFIESKRPIACSSQKVITNAVQTEMEHKPT